MDKQERFISRLNIIHGEKYDYSKTIFEHSFKKVIVTCKKHGDFLLAPSHLLLGHGCQQCSKEGRKNNYKQKELDNFFSKVKDVHGDKYDYSKINYVRAGVGVEIVCPIHGSFFQRLNRHLAGSGCIVCHTDSRRSDSQTFIEKAKEIHGEKYNYDLVDYKFAAKHVIVTCPKHGDFKITPNHHLGGKGCNDCGNEKIALMNLNTLETVLEQFKEVHGDTYDYSKVDYKGTKFNVEIVCKEHGSFFQKSTKHISGQKCPKCSASNGEHRVRVVLEKFGIEYISEYKFNDCRNIFALPFDFAIFNNGELLGLIEYQGQQHFFVPSWSKNKETNIKNFEDTLFRDSIKKKYCEDNNIPILYISYEEFNIVEDKILEFLKFLGR